MNPWEGFAFGFAITAGILAAMLLAWFVALLFGVGAQEPELDLEDEPPDFFDEEDTRPTQPIIYGGPSGSSDRQRMVAARQIVEDNT